jgi:hypothetical protein
MEVINLGEKVFAFKRVNQHNDSLLVVNNLTNETVKCEITGRFINIVNSNKVEFHEDLMLNPYEFMWLRPID